MIRAGALEAIKKLKENPKSFSYPRIGPLYTRIVRLRKDGGKPAWTAKDEHPKSIVALMSTPYTKVE